MRKKILALGISFALLLGAVGCGGSDSANNTETEEATVESAAQDEAETEVNDTDSSAAANSDDSFVYSGDPVTIKVGANITPHSEILEQAKPLLAEQGITCIYWSNSL